mmetsp:Transcript_117553/g.332577  ORF Transcript_117553/g.332577 Transcript_117553/m.332577 type:complete len:216 (+) Transcript_117553:576-1223(+)
MFGGMAPRLGHGASQGHYRHRLCHSRSPCAVRPPNVRHRAAETLNRRRFQRPTRWPKNSIARRASLGASKARAGRLGVVFGDSGSVTRSAALPCIGLATSPTRMARQVAWPVASRRSQVSPNEDGRRLLGRLRPAARSKHLRRAQGATVQVRLWRRNPLRSCSRLTGRNPPRWTHQAPNVVSDEAWPLVALHPTTQTAKTRLGNCGWTRWPPQHL